LTFEFSPTESVRKFVSISYYIITGANDFFAVHSVQKTMSEHKITTIRTIWISRQALRGILFGKILHLRMVAVVYPLCRFY
jgi:hypothetical protein